VPDSDQPGRSISVNDIDESFVPRSRARVAGVVLGGEAVLLDEDTSAMHVLNQTATLVWACIDGRGSIGEIVADLADACCADSEMVRRDVLDLASELGRQGLLEGVAACHRDDRSAQQR